MCTRWRPLCPEALAVAGLTARSPEGTGERRAPYNEVYTALPQRGLPSEAMGHKHQGFFVENFLARRTVLRLTFGFEVFDHEHRSFHEPRSCGGVRVATLTFSSQVKLSFIVIPLHVGTYSGTRCRASQDHGAT